MGSSSPAVKRNGGARPGAGRKKGTVARRIRKIRDMTQAAIDNVKSIPLEVMLKNMDRFDREADTLFVKLGEIIEHTRPAKNAPYEEQKAFLKQVTELMGKMRECRLDAQKCAVDAAPFMHPRLSAIAVKVENTAISAKPESQQSEEELADYYSKLRTRPTSTEPLIIDNETGAPMAPAVDEFEFEQ